MDEDQDLPARPVTSRRDDLIGQELDAMRTCWNALSELDDAQQLRAVQWLEKAIGGYA